MEWVKFYAAFYNLETEAAVYFDTAMKKVDEIIAVTAEIPDDQKVKVGWGIVTGGKIYVENAGSSSAQMVRDCGGVYVFDDIGVGKSGVSELTAEEFYSRMSTADVFVNRGMPKYGPDIDSILEQFPILAEIACLQEGKVLQITDNYWNSYHDIDGKYIEMAEFFYPDKFNDITMDQFIHFLIMPQTVG
jgi:iron complex transport system substrate-binding protein